MGKRIQEIERKIEDITFRLQGFERKWSNENNAKRVAEEVAKKIEELAEERFIPCYPSTKESSLIKSVKEKQKDLKIVEKYIKTLSGPCLGNDYLQVRKTLHERMEERGVDFCVDGRVLLAAFEIESKKKTQN